MTKEDFKSEKRGHSEEERDSGIRKK